jgi:hypothetical protein
MKHFETIGFVPNAVIGAVDLNQMPLAENLTSLNASSVNFMTAFALSNLYIGNCQELSSLILNNSTGLVIAADTPTVPAVPKDWAGLTKISTLNFGSCGFTEASVNNLLIGLSNRANEGLGSSVLTAKIITLNGINAKPLLTNALVASAKANLIAKGWTITHN